MPSIMREVLDGGDAISYFNSLRPIRKGLYFADDNLRNSVDENSLITIEMWLKYVP